MDMSSIEKEFRRTQQFVKYHFLIFCAIIYPITSIFLSYALGQIRTAVSAFGLPRTKFILLLPIGELNWNGILRNIREIKDLLTIVLPEAGPHTKNFGVGAGIIPDFSTIYA